MRWAKASASRSHDYLMELVRMKTRIRSVKTKVQMPRISRTLRTPRGRRSLGKEWVSA
jgi:hypothetical protein